MDRNEKSRHSLAAVYCIRLMHLLIYRAVGDKSGEAHALNNIGSVYYDLVGDQKRNRLIECSVKTAKVKS